ncbi:MAG: transposase [Ignavibacteriae bacterium]|nr:transposase [Ignavibacteriota bacterium]
MQQIPLLEPGGYYHIYNRGNNREDIFHESRNYDYFLTSFFKHLGQTVELFAYCLLKNHFHLLVRIKHIERINIKPNTQQQFSNFFNSYAKAINKAYERTGSLFQKRFSRKAITSEEYLIKLICYIHCNPEIHGFVEDYKQYPHSSYRAIVTDSTSRIPSGEMLNLFGGLKAFEEQHHYYMKERNFFGVDEEPV